MARKTLTPLQRLRRVLRPVEGTRTCLRFGANGTGAFWLDGRSLPGRVAVWFLLKGRMPQGSLVSTCGTPCCAQVGHMVDMVEETGACADRTRVHQIGSWIYSLNAVAEVLHLEDLGGSPALTEVTCPVCGAPPVFGTCIFCEAQDEPLTATQAAMLERRAA